MSYLVLTTIFHTALSIVALLIGIVAVGELFRAESRGRAQSVFIALAAVTSATGFVFPFHGVTPAIIIGVVALAILAMVQLACRRFALIGAWRWLYAAGLVASLYLLVFVTIVQAFLKIPVLHALAPTQSEAPFAAVQLLALGLFVFLGIAASLRFRPASEEGHVDALHTAKRRA
ncbi:hypothetical protein [Sphingosinithalassobacter portus]|uniref:hypothetical protein n=1 Tax=Stakelama portus TaxID=2676234 RepID=UPI000D6E6C52|nr:hypothetical protein [Sphingosinithalassobacter portus]